MAHSFNTNADHSKVIGISIKTANFSARLSKISDNTWMFQPDIMSGFFTYEGTIDEVFEKAKAELIRIFTNEVHREFKNIKRSFNTYK